MKNIKVTLQDMMKFPSRKVEYADYNQNEILVCPICEWIGMAKDGCIEHGDANLTVECPNCDKMLLIASYPLAQ